MRPLVQPEWDPSWEGASLADAVRDAYGRYCSTCERPLPQVAFAWDAREGVLVDGAASEAAWQDLLVLCHNCAGASTVWLAAPGDRLVLPHRNLTFALEDSAHIAYGPVSTAWLSGEQSPGEAQAQPSPIHALAQSARGMETIVRFALNWPVRGLHPDAPQRPIADPATISFWDPRVDLRTAAWHRAVSAAALLREAPPEIRDALVEQLRVQVEYTGFWSVWATVLSRELADSELRAPLIDALLSSRAGPFPATHDGGLAGARGS